MVEDDDDDHELYELVDLAKPLGFFVTRAKFYDPLRGGGPYLLMRRKEHPEQKNSWLLRYATADDVKFFLEQAAKTFAA